MEGLANDAALGSIARAIIVQQDIRNVGRANIQEITGVLVLATHAGHRIAEDGNAVLVVHLLHIALTGRC